MQPKNAVRSLLDVRCHTAVSLQGVCKVPFLKWYVYALVYTSSITQTNENTSQVQSCTPICVKY